MPFAACAYRTRPASRRSASVSCRVLLKTVIIIGTTQTNAKRAHTTNRHRAKASHAPTRPNHNAFGLVGVTRAVAKCFSSGVYDFFFPPLLKMRNVRDPKPRTSQRGVLHLRNSCLPCLSPVKRLVCCPQHNLWICWFDVSITREDLAQTRGCATRSIYACYLVLIVDRVYDSKP